MRQRSSTIVAALILAHSFAWSSHAYAGDPTVAECLTASNASIKLRAEHKLRHARSTLLVCAAATCPAEIREECSQRVAQVNAALPTIVFEVKDSAGRGLSAARVTMDGEVVAEHLDGSALTLDPGDHAFVFEVAGQAPVTQHILLYEADKGRHVPITLSAAPALVAPVQPPPREVASPNAASPDTAPPSNETGHNRRLAGLIVGGTGVAGVVVGAVFGGLTLSEASSANHACPSHNDCPANAVSDRSSAVTFGAVADVGFIAGGLLVAAGIVLYATAPKGQVATIGLQASPGGLTLAGRF
jgi:hypothetical protein